MAEALEGPQKKVAKKLESGMRSFSSVLRHTETSVRFGDFYLSVSRELIERSRDALDAL